MYVDVELINGAAKLLGSLVALGGALIGCFSSSLWRPAVSVFP